ncbi:hypothetical protein HUE58_03055 [Candidatus Ruthia endofausta]|uniref:Uncharacterized protein n=1 Tax=Candidatus Ruthia endofausta TaxID=2738852 RepID=A0A6N0HRB9_9GAMM|nr:hypothetical protein HUE58_03055 [Candidatus Ruthia endofausta]
MQRKKSYIDARIEKAKQILKR